MKVFITGGAGNIGQYVTLAVAVNGREAVVLLRSLCCSTWKRL